MSKLMRCLALVILLAAHAARAELDVHFLDVGQGDAALVVCDGEAMLIDGGPVTASQYLFSYLRQNVDALDVVVATHPHDDHIGGLAAALNGVPCGMIYSPVTEWDGISWTNVQKYAEAQGIPIVVPDEGDTFPLGGAVVSILHCWPDAWAENDMSIVLRVDYGATGFLFTGDAEKMSEYMMLDSKVLLRADVLKVAHHGSGLSSSPEFISAVNPAWAVISCGAGNAFGHPHDQVLRALKRAAVLRTDQAGTIVFHSDGAKLTVATSVPPAIEIRYYGNRKTLKFHRPECDSVAHMGYSNKVPLERREDALEMGYKPCGWCRP